MALGAGGEAPPGTAVDQQAKIEQLKQLAEADPEDGLTFFLLGCEQIQAGSPAEAAQTLARAVELSPDHTAAIRKLADAYRLMGDAEMARGAYAQAVEAAERTGDLQVAKEAQVFLRKLERERHDP